MGKLVMADDWKADVKRLADAVDRVGKDAQLLRRDVRRLGERLIPGEWEEPFELPSHRRGPRSFAAMFDELHRMRNSLFSLSGYIAQMTSRVDVIENDVVSREEMKKWIIEAKPHQRRDQD